MRLYSPSYRSMWKQIIESNIIPSLPHIAGLEQFLSMYRRKNEGALDDLSAIYMQFTTEHWNNLPKCGALYYGMQIITYGVEYSRILLLLHDLATKLPDHVEEEVFLNIQHLMQF